MWAAKAKARKKIPLGKFIIEEGEEITITHGRKHRYALWHYSGVYDLPKEYVKDINEISGLEWKR
jgi:hypothetical protein